MFLSESQWKFGTFSILTLKQILWKTKTFFKKLKYCFLLETTKIENALFSYKSAISEANVKTNRMVGRKWTYHKEKSFASYCFILLKILFQLKNLLQRVDFMYQRPKCLFILFVSAGYFFPASILNYSKTLKMFEVDTC